MLNLILSGRLKDSFCSVKELISFCRVSFGFWNSRDVSAHVFRCNDEKKNVSSSLWSWKSKILYHDPGAGYYTAADPGAYSPKMDDPKTNNWSSQSLGFIRIKNKYDPKIHFDGTISYSLSKGYTKKRSWSSQFQAKYERTRIDIRIKEDCFWIKRAFQSKSL